MYDVKVTAFDIAFLVRISESAGDPGNNEGGYVDWDLTIEDPMTFNQLLEMHAAHKFHYHEILSANLTEVIGLDDIGVDQVGDESGFADKVFLELRNGGLFFADELNGDNLAEITRTALDGFIHQPHAALSDLAGKLVVQLIEDMF
jgi:hypothetical protein